MQVTIDKQSWHYRWYRFITDKFRGQDFYWEDPQSVCPYFWGFILNNLWALFMCLVFALIAVILTFIFTAPVWATIAYFIFGNAAAFDWIIIGGGTWLAIAGIGVKLYYDDNKYQINKKIDDATSTGFVGVTKAYAIGAKKKFCPTIKYIGDEE